MGRFYQQRIHFVGIGGAGMAGLAEVCHNLGHKVTGSDISANYNVEHLKKIGIKIVQGHRQLDLAKNSNVVVISSAINLDDNQEIRIAKKNRIPIIPRAEMLAELMRSKYGIAVAGTHGKTTTTSLIAAIMTEAQLDPTYVIGGKLQQIGTNARLGQSEFLVAEADESDTSFLHLRPMTSIITNVEKDHMENYAGNEDNIKKAFLEFINLLPFYGKTIVNLDCQNITQMLDKFSRRAITYSVITDNNNQDKQADYQAYDLKFEHMQSKFKVISKNKKEFDITLNLPGEHNVSNALGAIALTLELNLDKKFKIKHIQNALLKFAGVGRRFNIYNNIFIGNKRITLVDDYGHHPTEINATIKAARQVFPSKRLVLVFQPHRFSRTKFLFDSFIENLIKVDLLVLLPVYAAGEKPIKNFDSSSLIQTIRTRGFGNAFLSDKDKLDSLLHDIVQQNDILLFMGAGDIAAVIKQFKGV